MLFVIFNALSFLKIIHKFFMITISFSRIY